MRTRIYAVDGDTQYASISFIPDAIDNISNEELIRNINNKNKRKDVCMKRVHIGSDTQWFGPQRYAKDTGAFLELTNEEGFWVDPISNTMYYDEDIQSYPLYDIESLPKKVRSELNQEEQSWMAVHEVELDTGYDPFWNEYVKCSFVEEVNTDDGEGEVITQETKTYDVMISKENTEITTEECRFWKRISWLIGHSHKKAIEYCKRYSNAKWFDQEKKEYIWELIKDDNTPKFKYAQFLMMQAREYIATHEMPVYTKTKIEEPLFTSFSWTKVPSYKYKGEWLYSLKARMYGTEVECHRVGKNRNWISSGNMSQEQFNLFLDYAKSQIVK